MKPAGLRRRCWPSARRGDIVTNEDKAGGGEPVIFLPVQASTATAIRPGWAIVGIFIIMLVGAIAISRDFLMPITMSVLLFFVFSPLRRRLGRRGVPGWVTATIVTTGLLAAMGAVVLMLMGPAGQLIADAPTISHRLEQKFDALRDQIRGLQDVATKIDEVAAAEGPEPGVIKAETKPESLTMSVVNATPALIGQLLFVLILLFFLLTSGDLLYLRIVQSFDTLKEKRMAYQALRQIEDSLGSYLGTISLINIGLGAAIGITFWLMGMPAPSLFGVTAFLLNYIPYVGLVIGAVSATAVALVSMDGFFWPVMVGAAYVAINSVEGQFVTPYFLSRRLELNTVVVFVAVALWAWLWSVVGMIVAVPILVVIRVLCEHIPGMEKFANFLAGEDAPSALPESEAEEESAPSATAAR